MTNHSNAIHGTPTTAALLMTLAACIALFAWADAAWAGCPCDVDPATICVSGDCSDLPPLNYEAIDEALHAFAATEGTEGDGLISCGGNFSDITAVAGIRRGPYPGSLMVRAELDRCLAVQTYDDENGVMQTNYYSVDIASEADAALCLAAVHHVCNDAAHP